MGRYSPQLADGSPPAGDGGTHMRALAWGPLPRTVAELSGDQRGP